MSTSAAEDLSATPERLAIVVPVYDDWEAVLQLVEELGRALAARAWVADLVLVDDASHLDPSRQAEVDTRLAARFGAGEVEIVRLAVNLGHQRAIAIGLAQLYERGRQYRFIAVLDGDGEDRPADLIRLVEIGCEGDRREGARIVVAKRRQRSEGLRFRIFYAIYRLLFRWLAGVTIDFGNFALIPASLLGRVVYSPHVWNHFAAGLLRARLPLNRVPVDRGVRYAGRSRMNTQSLMLHGLSAVSVYIEVVLLRALVVLGLGTVLLGFSAAIAAAIRLFSQLAIPGWATNVVGILAIGILQMFSLAIIMVLLTLALRSLPTMVPALDGARFIADTRRLVPLGRADDVSTR